MEESLVLYDLSLKEKYYIRAAEKLYFPNIPFEIYSSLVSESEEIFEILSMLNSGAGQPSSVQTFLVSFSNFCAALIAAGADHEVFSHIFKEPPKELKHKSLRVVSKSSVIENILKNRSENMKAG